MLLQHAGAHTALNVVAAARFEHDAIDSRPLQEMRQEKPGWSRPDDSDLRAHHTPCIPNSWQHMKFAAIMFLKLLEAG